MAKLILGSNAGELGVEVFTDDESWTGTAVLYKVEDDGKTQTVITWPDLPILVFENGTEITPILSADLETSTPNSQATWHMTELEISELHTGMDCRLRMNGETKFTGEVLCRT